MSHPHCEDGGQDYVLLDSFKPITASKLYVVLKQPSPHWIKFGLKDLKCFTGSADRQEIVRPEDYIKQEELNAVLGITARTWQATGRFAGGYQRFDAHFAYDLSGLE